jgi:hypothetical protein
MVLEGEGLTADLTHRVKVSGIATTTPYSHPVVTTPGNYSVTITNSTGNSCWGTLKVEDKLGPVVICLCPTGNVDPACEILCTDEAAFLAGTFTNYPKSTAVDACTAVTTRCCYCKWP